MFKINLSSTKQILSFIENSKWIQYCRRILFIIKRQDSFKIITLREHTIF